MAANDDKVQGDVETESSSANSRGLSRRPIPSFDPERCLIVELEPDEIETIRDAGTRQGGSAPLRLEITSVHCDANGFVHVVGELEPTDLPPDFLSLDAEDEPLGQLDEELE